MSELLNSAIIYATKAHGNALRKGTNLPYIIHPLEALAIAATITDDEAIIAATVLHDVLEDTSVSENKLRAAFGEKVLALVRAETENKRLQQSKADTWHVRKAETIAHLQSASWAEQAIVLADKLSNLRAMARDEKAIGESFWQRFNQKEKSAHGWYYREIAKNLTLVADSAAYQEFAVLIATVFGENEEMKEEI